MLGSGAVYALATVAPVLVSLLVTPLVTRALGAEGFGVVGVSITLYQMGAIVLGLGLSASITRHAIIGGSGVRGAVALVFCGAAAAVLLGAVLAALIPLWGPIILGGAAESTVLVWPVLSAVSLSILTLTQSVYRAVERVKTFVALGVLSAFAGPGLGLIAIMLLGPTPGDYLAGVAIGHTTAAAAGLFLLPRISRADFSLVELRENLAIGLPTVPHSVASALLVSTLVILASLLQGVEAAGQLQLALFLGTAPLIVLGAFNNAWAPMIYRAPDEERTALLTRSTRAVAVLVFLLTGGFAVAAEPVARFIAGPQIYSPGLLDAALVASTATAFMAVYLSNMHLVFLSGRTGMLAITTPASAAVAIAGVVAVSMLGWQGLVALALGIPLFHISQSIVAGVLRRRTRFAGPALLGAVPVLILAAAAPLAVAWLHPPLLIAAAAFVVCAAAVAVSNRRILR
ncbi:lipopolysaccharide biosynthesis protein [Microbacterium sp. HJ5]